jgi:hypothetical protein
MTADIADEKPASLLFRPRSGRHGEFGFYGEGRAAADRWQGACDLDPFGDHGPPGELAETEDLAVQA